MNELPDDAWQHIARCLTGTDLFELALTSRFAWRCFSHDNYWRDRLPLDESASMGKGLAFDAADASATAHQDSRDGKPPMLQRYLQAFSFQFDGLATAVCRSEVRSTSSIDVTTLVRASAQTQSAFTFDVWFSLLDTSGGPNASTNSEERHLGGALFAGVSRHLNLRGGPRHRGWLNMPPMRIRPHLFAVVSADKKLYCSVTQEHPESVADLELHRWYHLALTFSDGDQNVYLDGELVSWNSHTESSLSSRLRNAYIGDGRVRGNHSRHLPTPGSSGWYPFNGVIDTFRFWDRALSSDKVQALARGEESKGSDTKLIYSLKRDALDVASSGPRRICCTRPRERVAQVVRSDKSGDYAAIDEYHDRQCHDALAQHEAANTTHSRLNNSVSRTAALLDNERHAETDQHHHQEQRLDLHNVFVRSQPLALAIAVLAVGLIVKAAV